MKHFLLFLSAVPVLLLAGCSDKKESKQTNASASPAMVQVPVISARQDQPEYTLTLPGELRPFEQVELYPKVKGFIKALYADRGSQVKKGQLLALLEAPEITQQYLAAKANSSKLYESLRYSKQSFARLKKAAAKSGAVAAIELDKARTQLGSDSAAYVAALASTRALAQMQDYLRIRAPFSGTVTGRNVSVGALVGEQTKAAALFTLAQQDHLRLTVAIPEKHAPSLQPGTPVSFTVSGRPGKLFTSALSRNGLLVNQQERSVTAEFDVDNQDKALNGGEYARVKLSLRRPEPSVWVPVPSVVRAQEGVFVLQVADGRIRRVPVTEGTRRDTLQEVFGQVQAGDWIVQKGTEELAEGTPVKAILPQKQNQQKAVAAKK